MSTTLPTGELRAVLFDMDGTLVDSEKLWSIALTEVADELGGTLSPEARAAMVGTDMVSSIRVLIGDLGVEADPDVVKRLLVATVAREFGRALEWRPGAYELLRAVRRADLAAALVTSTHRNLTSQALELIGASHFDVIVCGDDVERTKPDPQPYQQALDALDIDPAHAVAIEDSPAGSTAAIEAGVATLVVPLEVPVTARPGLTIRESLIGVTVDDLRALLG